MLFALAILVGAGIGIAVALAHHSSSSNLALQPTRPDASWPAGVRRAPDFRLRDQDGRSLTLTSFRGSPVILTFIDPLCRNLCPLEARVLSDMEKKLPASARPAIVSVSVNPWADTRANFSVDARKWNLASNWRWGVGSYRRLASVWQRYQIGVLVQKKVVAGITVRQISHTEGSYVIDPRGFVRALFLYPFSADDVARVVQRVARGA